MHQKILDPGGQTTSIPSSSRPRRVGDRHTRRFFRINPGSERRDLPRVTLDHWRSSRLRLFLLACAIEAKIARTSAAPPIRSRSPVEKENDIRALSYRGIPKVNCDARKRWIGRINPGALSLPASKSPGPHARRKSEPPPSFVSCSQMFDVPGGGNIATTIAKSVMPLPRKRRPRAPPLSAGNDHGLSIFVSPSNEQ